MGDDLDGLKVVSEVIEDADWVAQSLSGPRSGHRRPLLRAWRARRGTRARQRAWNPGRSCARLRHRPSRHDARLPARVRSIAEGTRPRHVLDLGTGTGVLGIAAAKAPGQGVAASDIDPTSVIIARENAALNRVADRVRVVHANGMNHPIDRGERALRSDFCEYSCGAAGAAGARRGPGCRAGQHTSSCPGF